MERILLHESDPIHMQQKKNAHCWVVICYRLRRFSKCIHWICQCRRCEQRCGRSLRDIDMWINYTWWICCFFRAMPNFRYDQTSYFSSGVHRWILSLIWVIRGTAPVVMQRASSEDELSRSQHDRWQSGVDLQETLNYWKQLPHILKYFIENENSVARLPQNFMQRFLEVMP